MKLYKVQDLGLPDRWNNFTVFSSEVSRLVLLSERGRTHGSIWGVPPFLEGILRATVATTMTTSYFYSYINTSSYQTTYTITIRARQSAYSVMGEWWESNDGKNWYKVTSTTGRDGQSCSSSPVQCFQRQECYYTGDWQWISCTQYDVITCSNGGCFGPQSPTASQLITTLTANGRQIVSFNPPIILYFRANESVAASAGITSYTISGVSWSCYQEYLGSTGECVESRVVTVTFAGGIVGYRTECLKYKTTSYYQCVQQYTEWSRTYKLQAIELVDWDTGEVYASLNQTSLTFNINRNTIVRFKYVLTSSWSRSWQVILQPPPSTTPEDCQKILNDQSKVSSLEWCRCASIYDPATYNDICIQSCLYVSVSPCCSGDTSSGCLDSWSKQGGQDCKIFSSGTQKLSAGWSASWSLKSGWTLADIGKAGPGDCKIPPGGLVNNGASGSASGTCSVDAEPNRGYHVSVIVIFKKTQ